MGRISSLTQEIQDAFCHALERGNTIECAAGLVGVNAATIYRWRKLGREGDAKFREFYEATKSAEAKVEAICTNAFIAAAEGGDWKAGQAWLERRRSLAWWLQRPGRGEPKKPEDAADPALNAMLLKAFLNVAAQDPKFGAEAMKKLIETGVIPDANRVPDGPEPDDGDGT